MLKNMARTLPNHRGLSTASPTSTTSSSSGVSSAASQYFSGSKSSSKSCDRIHALGRSTPGGNNARMRRDKSLDSHVKYRTEAKSKSIHIFLFKINLNDGSGNDKASVLVSQEFLLSGSGNVNSFLFDLKVVLLCGSGM